MRRSMPMGRVSPHGVVKSVQYKAGVRKTMHVYTPPEYETNTAATYPVLYINHGGGEGDRHWGCTDSYNCLLNAPV